MARCKPAAHDRVIDILMPVPSLARRQRSAASKRAGDRPRGAMKRLPASSGHAAARAGCCRSRCSSCGSRRPTCRGLGLGITVPFGYCLVFMPIGLLLLLLPVSISGFGLPQGRDRVAAAAECTCRSRSAFALSTLIVLSGLAGNLPGAWLYLRESSPSRGSNPLSRPVTLCYLRAGAPRRRARRVRRQ